MYTIFFCFRGVEGVKSKKGEEGCLGGQLLIGAQGSPGGA